MLSVSSPLFRIETSSEDSIPDSLCILLATHLPRRQHNSAPHVNVPKRFQIFNILYLYVKQKSSTAHLSDSCVRALDYQLMLLSWSALNHFCLVAISLMPSYYKVCFNFWEYIAIRGWWKIKYHPRH